MLGAACLGGFVQAAITNAPTWQLVLDGVGALVMLTNARCAVALKDRQLVLSGLLRSQVLDIDDVEDVVVVPGRTGAPRAAIRLGDGHATPLAFWPFGDQTRFADQVRRLLDEHTLERSELPADARPDP